MKFSVGIVCAVLLSLGASATEQRRDRGEDGEGEATCLADPADTAELSVLSGQNASGHWLAKVRLLHAAGAAGDGAALQPVHLQVQRSAHRRLGGARTVALEATLAGSPTASADEAAMHNGILESAFSEFPDPKTSCPPPQPRPTCPKPPPCPSPCPAPCPTCPSPVVCPQPPTCPSPCPALCPVCPTCPSPVVCPEPPKCPSPCPTPVPAPKRIPPGYVLKEGLGYYKYHTVQVNWFQAKATCEREGAHLVILNSKEEATMVVNFYKELGLPLSDYGYGIRVGLHDLITEGSFLTVLGQPIAATGFTDWNPGEPNNALTGEDCVTLYHNSNILDISCDWNGTFVCEFPY